MNRKTACILYSGISVLLMALPYGVNMEFSADSAKYSYFSMMPLGYGNFLPMITGIVAIAAFILTVVNIKKDLSKQAMILFVIAINLSLVSWFMFSSVTPLGVIIFILHVVCMALLKNNS